MKKLFVIILLAIGFLSCSKKEDPIPTTGTLKFKVSFGPNSKDATVNIYLYLEKYAYGNGEPELYKTSADMKPNTSKIFDAGEYLPGYYYYIVTTGRSYQQGYVMIVANRDKVLDCDFDN